MRRVLVLALLAAGCAGEGDAVLRVGGLGFTADEIASLPEDQRQALGDVAAWGQAVRDGAADSVLAPLAEHAEARSRLELLPSVLGARMMGLGEAALRRAYLARPDWELQVRHVLRRASPQDAEKVRDRARALAEVVLARAEEGEDFESLAVAFSEERGGSGRGGLLPVAREGSWDESFWNAAVALEPGEVSEVVQTPAGFHVIRLEDRSPVPYEEADRGRLLRRMVPAATALAAMRSWSARAPAVELDSVAARQAWAAFAAGEHGVTRLLARGDRGFSFTGVDLAAVWLTTDAGQRSRLLEAGEAGFLAWVGEVARDARWAAEADRMGVQPAPDAGARGLAQWHRAANQWVKTFGLRPRMSDRALKSAVLRAVSARDQEARIARQQIEELWPLLRVRYPMESVVAQ